MMNDYESLEIEMDFISNLLGAGTAGKFASDSAAG